MDDSTSTQEPQQGVEFPPDVTQALEAIGATLGAAMHPLAVALVEQREVTMLLMNNLTAAQAALGDVLDLVDKLGIRTNWAQDKALLESARELHAQLAPGVTGEPPSTEDHA